MFNNHTLALCAIAASSCSVGEHPGADRAGVDVLPYFNQAPTAATDVGKRGVTLARSEAEPGLTVYCSERSGRAELLDLAGRVVHTFDVGDALRCKLLEPYDDRSFLMLGNGQGLAKIAWDSTVEWHATGPRFHHDIAVTPTGHIWALTNRNRRINWNGVSVAILDDELALLTPEGEIVRTLSVYDAVASLIPPAVLDDLAERTRAGERWELVSGSPGDILHTNTIEFLPGESALGPAGTALIAMRHLDTIAAIDVSTGTVTWSWGRGELDMPHHPTLQPDGTVLLFDNGANRGWSRIIEMDPSSRAISWEYSNASPLFYSTSRGSVQRLPRGSYLVAESDRGRLFEIDRDGTLLWEYWAEESLNADGGFMRSTIYRTHRFTRSAAMHPALRAAVELSDRGAP